MIIYAVIDTNVIISALLKSDSTPGKLMNAAFDGKIQPIISKEIIEEYKEVLSRKKFSFSKEVKAAILSYFNNNAVVMTPKKTDEMFIDSEDVKFYEVTMGGREQKDAYLVTGNKKHFPVKPFVVSPKEMLDIIGIQG